jgi:hypothetical protein
MTSAHMVKIFVHFLIYLEAPIPSEFPYIPGKFSFLFYQCSKIPDNDFCWQLIPTFWDPSSDHYLPIAGYPNLLIANLLLYYCTPNECRFRELTKNRFPSTPEKAGYETLSDTGPAIKLNYYLKGKFPFNNLWKQCLFKSSFHSFPSQPGKPG